MRAFGVVAVIGGVTLGAWKLVQWRAAAGQEAAARQTAALQARLESIGYYRVKASYIVKDTGEHIDFDYVAACAVIQTNYRDGDRSVDTPFGVAPNTFIAPTRDGHAIQIVTPSACHHEAEEKNIPPDLIPLTIFYNDVMNLGFGWGYTSQDAYDNARAQISFEGATVTAATYSDLTVWRAKAKAEFKPFGKIRSPWGYSYERGSELDVPRTCKFFVRAPVFAAGKPALTAEWEKRGRPEFWMFGDGGGSPEFWSEFRSDGMVVNYLQPRTKRGGIGTIQNYNSQRSAELGHSAPFVFKSNEAYPYLPISLSSTPSPGLNSTVFPTKVPVSEDWKGLAACGENDHTIDHVFRGREFNAVDQGSKHVSEPIGARMRPFMANDTVVGEIRFEHPPKLFFQRDEFALTDQSNSVEGILP